MRREPRPSSHSSDTMHKSHSHEREMEKGRGSNDGNNTSTASETERMLLLRVRLSVCLCGMIRDKQVLQSHYDLFYSLFSLPFPLSLHTSLLPPPTWRHTLHTPTFPLPPSIPKKHTGLQQHSCPTRHPQKALLPPLPARSHPRGPPSLHQILPPGLGPLLLLWPAHFTTRLGGREGGRERGR